MKVKRQEMGTNYSVPLSKCSTRSNYMLPSVYRFHKLFELTSMRLLVKNNGHFLTITVWHGGRLN